MTNTWTKEAAVSVAESKIRECEQLRAELSRMRAAVERALALVSDGPALVRRDTVEEMLGFINQGV